MHEALTTRAFGRCIAPIHEGECPQHVLWDSKRSRTESEIQLAASPDGGDQRPSAAHERPPAAVAAAANGKETQLSTASVPPGGNRSTGVPWKSQLLRNCPFLCMSSCRSGNSGPSLLVPHAASLGHRAALADPSTTRSSQESSKYTASTSREAELRCWRACPQPRGYSIYLV
jgi:hypothetical protein